MIHMTPPSGHISYHYDAFALPCLSLMPSLGVEGHNVVPDWVHEAFPNLSIRKLPGLQRQSVRTTLNPGSLNPQLTSLKISYSNRLVVVLGIIVAISMKGKEVVQTYRKV